MESLKTSDFFKGLISYSVDNGKLQVWSPYGFRIRQPHEKSGSTEEMQAIMHIIENEDGQKFYVAMSKDGQKCAISNDELLAYELYWNADKPVGSKGINLNPNSNLNVWKQPTVQVANGTIGFVIDKIHGSKYVTPATDGIKELPEENFSKTLEQIKKELQQREEMVSHESGIDYCKKSVIGTYQNAISNIDGLSKISKRIERAYEEKEIKANMAQKAKLTEELAVIEFQIRKLEKNIKNGNDIFKYSEMEELKEKQAERAKKVAEIKSSFR